MRLETFQLIDRILAVSLEDRTIRTEATVPTESTIFQGHFPGMPLMPGALLLEAMAQTAGWLVIALTNFERMPFGILSCLGEGPQAHWQRLMEGKPDEGTKSIGPYVVHPIGTVDFDKQIPKRGDQRQMEPWQRIGTYAAGLALESAGIKGKPELLARTDMIVAAGSGERDLAADAAIIEGLPKAENPAAYLNERLMNDLRPSLFLEQLSNLLAGNISIVHGVTGSSRP